MRRLLPWVPQMQRAAGGPDRDLLTIPAEGQGDRLAVETVEGRTDRPTDPPQAHAAVRAARGNGGAVAAECQGYHGTAVAFERRSNRQAGFGIP